MKLSKEYNSVLSLLWPVECWYKTHYLAGCAGGGHYRSSCFVSPSVRTTAGENWWSSLSSQPRAARPSFPSPDVRPWLAGDSLMPGPEGRGNLMPAFLSSAVGPARALVSLQSRNWDREFKWDLLIEWWAFNEMQGIADHLFPDSDIWFTVRKWVASQDLIVIRKLYRRVYCKNLPLLAN